MTPAEKTQQEFKLFQSNALLRPNMTDHLDKNTVYFTQEEATEFFKEETELYEKYLAYSNYERVRLENPHLNLIKVKPVKRAEPVSAWENSGNYLSGILAHCVKRDDHETVEKILNRGFPVDTPVWVHPQPLAYFALKEGANKVFTTLLKHNCSQFFVETQMPKYNVINSLLFTALDRKKLDMFYEMVEHGYDIAWTDHYDHTIYWPMTNYDKVEEAKIFTYLLAHPRSSEILHHFNGNLGILTMALHHTKTHLFDILLEHTNQPKDLELFLEELETHLPSILYVNNDYQLSFENAKNSINVKLVKLEKLKLNAEIPAFNTASNTKGTTNNTANTEMGTEVNTNLGVSNILPNKPKPNKI